MHWTYADGSLDVATLRRLFETRELTPEQLVSALYDRIERNEHPNVFTYLVPRSQAVRHARALGSFAERDKLPLYGIPYAVKDNIDVAGLPTTAACPGFAYVPERSAPTVAALDRAGAICLGKTNLDQFATGLVGSRSPYGACRNVFKPEYLSGGSSSGSAVAVAAGYVSLALGTDTAGSGRVPAALNNVIGLKATKGLLSTSGVVPACRSLDCVSVFALNVPDAVLARELMRGERAAFASLEELGPGFRFGVPRALEWFGDEANEVLFARTLDLLESLGGRQVPVDFTPFRELGDLLYGPWVIERYLAVGTFIERQPEAVLPITRDIILGAKRYAAADAFRGFHALEALRMACEAELARVDVLVTPTVPTHFRLAQDAEDPRGINDCLGIYTRYANFLGVPVTAVPAGFRADGLPFGVSLVAEAGGDDALDALAAATHALAGAGMGRSRTPAPAHRFGALGPPREARLAVVGAHLRGFPLHSELLACGARFVCATRTEPRYRLFLIPNTQPQKPGLVHVSGAGHAIEVELFDLPWTGLGQLMSRVSAPLSIGSIRTGYGELVKGFLCEPFAVEGGQDISEFGGYRAYLEARGGS